MPLMQIHEPGETPLPHEGGVSVAVGIDLGTTNSVVAIVPVASPKFSAMKTAPGLFPRWSPMRRMDRRSWANWRAG